SPPVDRRIPLIAMILLVSAAGPASAPSPGQFQLTLTERSPLSSIKEQLRRFGWRWESIHTVKDEGDYDLASESFQVRVPKPYKAGEEGWGLLVWISPGPSGAAP